MISKISVRPVRLGYRSTAGRFELSYEDLQRGIINTAMQILAADRGGASPAAVSDLMVEKNDRFRGRPADRLIARLASLSSLNMVGEAGVVAAALKDSAVL